MSLLKLVSLEDSHAATHKPPNDTRAYFRGLVVEKWPDHIVNANWDSIVFDADNGPLRKVEMNEPLRGTQELVGPIIEQCASVSELLARLGSNSDLTGTV